MQRYFFQILPKIKRKIREILLYHTTFHNYYPVFIFGNQKSGTSVITALLGIETNLTYTIDILFRYNHLEEDLLTKKVPIKSLLKKAKNHFSKDIIKDPSFTLLYDDLKHKFPHCSCVFIVRDPRQNIRSILNRLKISGHLADLSSERWDELKKKHPNWYLVLEGSISGHQGESYIETLALRWKKFYHIYKENQQDMILVRYEDFVKDKVGSIQQLAKDMGLTTTNMAQFEKDRQFQPKGNSSVDLEVFFGIDNLRKIEDICKEEMMNLGYSDFH